MVKKLYQIYTGSTVTQLTLCPQGFTIIRLEFYQN